MHVYIDHEKVDLLVYLNYGAFNLNLGKCIYMIIMPATQHVLNTCCVAGLHIISGW